MGDIKQTNFRIDQTTADAFRHFCEDNGMNQAQGFDHIMQVVELDKAKAVTPSRITEIEGFEKSIKDILAAYLYSIEVNNNAEARVREQFSSALDRKDKTIDDLQKKVEQLQQSKKSSDMTRMESAIARSASEERERNAIIQLEAAKKTAADQERINQMLTAQIAELTAKQNRFEQLAASESALKSEVIEWKQKAQESMTALSHTKELYETRLADAKETSEKCNILQKNVDELKEKLEQAEKVLSDQTRSAETTLKQMQMQAELEKERAVMMKERELYEKIRLADKENARLAYQVEQLQEQIDHFSR